MEQVKKAHKKVGKKAKKLTAGEALSRWMISVNNDLTDTMMSVRRMRVVVWKLFIFSVVIITAAFLLVLYGNQYLVR